MTTNQIAYLKMMNDARNTRFANYEARRANLAKESETNRSNLAKEAETYRANVTKESETERTNRENERLKKTQNIIGITNAITGGIKNVAGAFSEASKGAGQVAQLAMLLA